MFTYIGVMSPQGRKGSAVIHRKIYSLSASSVVILFSSHLQKFKTRHDFQAFYAMTSGYLISWFYCMIQFGWMKNIRTERGRFREHVRNSTPPPPPISFPFFLFFFFSYIYIYMFKFYLDVTLEIVLFMLLVTQASFGMKAKKSVLSNSFKKLMSGQTFANDCINYSFLCSFLGIFFFLYFCRALLLSGPALCSRS